jgi:hypothetical protein
MRLEGIVSNATQCRERRRRIGAGNDVDDGDRQEVRVMSIDAVATKKEAAAVECYRSPEYAKAMAHRQGKSVMDLAIVEGYDGPQPTDM